MPDFKAKKSDYLSEVVAFSDALREVVRRAEELTAYRADNEFQIGGANAISDLDCIGDNAHLTAAAVDAAVLTAQGLVTAMTLPRRKTLRVAGRKPQS